jgi:hypothetical protein
MQRLCRCPRPSGSRGEPPGRAIHGLSTADVQALVHPSTISTVPGPVESEGPQTPRRPLPGQASTRIFVRKPAPVNRVAIPSRSHGSSST